MSKPDLDITLDTTLVTEVVNATPSERLNREGTLTVLVGADVGSTFKLIDDVTEIGRSPDCGVTLADESVSRVHTRIRRVDKHFELEDLGSTNGTIVGETRVQGRLALSDGVRIQLGRTILRFALLDQIDQQASQRMYEMSVRDGLTGVYNRRYLDERIASEFAFAARHRAALCVLLCDVDHFKNINDRYGHHAGDHVLRKLGAQLQTSVRTEDVLARYGGEEFAILARGIDVAGAKQFAERIRTIIEGTRFIWEGQRIAVTLSIGVAHNHAGGAATKPEGLVAAADAALYTAKRAGRNRTELAVSPGRYSGVDENSLRETQDAERDGARDRARTVQAARVATAPVELPKRPAAPAVKKRGVTTPIEPTSSRRKPR